MIWKYLPHSDKHYDLFITILLIAICITVLIIHNRQNNEDTIQGKGVKIDSIKGNTTIFYSEGNQDINKQSSLESKQSNYLRMNLEKESRMNFQMDSEGNFLLNEEVGKLFVFSLSNPSNRLAIIESIYLDVLDVVKDKVAGPEGQAQKYEYELRLDPHDRGEKIIAKDFKYKPGEVDKFYVDIKTSKYGYDYFLRFAVDWYDSEDGLKRKLTSKILFADFSNYRRDLSVAEVRKWHNKTQKILRAHANESNIRELLMAEHRLLDKKMKKAEKLEKIRCGHYDIRENYEELKDE
ncbi:hypothetical protein C5S31_07500 [ANME-1 cluster archaeon GoMg2]|nr:hypothetical protein [ANME-1 cluster archaeon GoMg2]